MRKIYVLFIIFISLIFIAPCCQNGPTEYIKEQAEIINVAENISSRYGAKTTVEWTDNNGNTQRYVMDGIIGEVDERITIYGRKKACKDWVWTSYFKEQD